MAITGKKPSEWSAATITAVKEVLSLNSANYITVDVGVDAKANGANLIAAYTAAKALTPNGAALSATNRACVIVPPGNYDLDHGEDDACVPLTLDTEFVDIIGLTTDRELQHIYGTPEATNSGVIVQTANDVHISNLTVEILTEVAWDEVEDSYPLNYDNTDSAAYFPSTNLNNTVIDNCAFVGMEIVDWDNPPATTPICSMRWGILEYSGTFTNCTGGEGAFGGDGGTASGTFSYCTGGDVAFGGDGGTASGTFKDCTGGEGAFGGDGIASGTFTNCTGGEGAFGGDGIASGTFTNCTGGEYAFGGVGTASGTFKDCMGGEYAFGGVGTASGTFTNCTGGEYAFGGEFGTASGTFKDCTGGVEAFGSYGTASGTFTNCTGDYGAFGGGDGGTASGTFTNCTGGENAFGSGGTASGTFNSCTGGDYAFGGTGIASGTFSFCKLTDAFGTLKCTVATVEIASGGTLYEIDDELTVVGGTGAAATLKVTSVTDGVIDGIQVLTVGNYTALPSNPVATTGHTEDATFNLTWNEGHIYGCVDSTGFIAEKNWDD